MSDVILINPEDGDILRYNGSSFVNLKMRLNNDDFYDVSFTSITNGDLIKYDGTNFVNFAPNYLETANIYELGGLSWANLDNNELIRKSGDTTAEGCGMTVTDTNSASLNTKTLSYFNRDDPFTVSLGANKYEKNTFGYTQRIVPYSPLLTTGTEGLYLYHTPDTNNTNVSVGVNINNPAEPLHVKGKVRIDEDTTQTLTFHNTQGGQIKEHGRIELTDNAGGADLLFYTRPSGGNEPTEKLRIDKNGAIGIEGANFGTTGQVLSSGGSGNPVSWQDQIDTTYSEGTGVTINASNEINIGQPVAITDSPEFKQLYIGASGVNQAILNFQDLFTFTAETIAQIKAIKDGASGGELEFYTKPDGLALQERLRITKAGAWFLNGTNSGFLGQVLTSNGSGSPPTWETPYFISFRLSSNFVWDSTTNQNNAFVTVNNWTVPAGLGNSSDLINNTNWRCPRSGVYRMDGTCFFYRRAADVIVTARARVRSSSTIYADIELNLGNTQDDDFIVTTLNFNVIDNFILNQQIYMEVLIYRFPGSGSTQSELVGGARSMWNIQRLQ